MHFMTKQQLSASTVKVQGEGVGDISDLFAPKPEAPEQIQKYKDILGTTRLLRKDGTLRTDRLFKGDYTFLQGTPKQRRKAKQKFEKFCAAVLIYYNNNQLFFEHPAYKFACYFRDRMNERTSRKKMPKESWNKILRLARKIYNDPEEYPEWVLTEYKQYVDWALFELPNSNDPWLAKMARKFHTLKNILTDYMYRAYVNEKKTETAKTKRQELIDKYKKLAEKAKQKK